VLYIREIGLVRRAGRVEAEVFYNIVFLKAFIFAFIIIEAFDQRFNSYIYAIKEALSALT
jgi:hypothetical protein